MGKLLYITAMIAATLAVLYITKNSTARNGDDDYLIPREVKECEELGRNILQCAISLENNRADEFLAAFIDATPKQKSAMRDIITKSNAECPTGGIKQSLCMSSSYYEAIRIRYPDRWK